MKNKDYGLKKLDTRIPKELTDPHATLKKENINKGVLLKLGLRIICRYSRRKRLKIKNVNPEKIDALKKVETEVNNVGLKHPANTQKLFNQMK